MHRIYNITISYLYCSSTPKSIHWDWSLLCYMCCKYKGRTLNDSCTDFKGTRMVAAAGEQASPPHACFQLAENTQGRQAGRGNSPTYHHQQWPRFSPATVQEGWSKTGPPLALGQRQQQAREVGMGGGVILSAGGGKGWEEGAAMLTFFRTWSPRLLLLPCGQKRECGHATAPPLDLPLPTPHF